MSTRWQEVWNRRRLGDDQPGLQSVIDLDGFDSPFGRVDAGSWRSYVALLSAELGLANGDSVYEVGCGGGALLMALAELHDVKLAGSDYAGQMIEAARRVLPGLDLEVVEAVEVPAEPAFDHVVSNGTFLYFPSLDYAARALAAMIAKARTTVAVLEMPDLALHEEAERYRRASLTPEAYATRYEGLGHQYYERSWFEQQAAAHGLECRIVPSLIPAYDQGRFRFGAILTRAG